MVAAATPGSGSSERATNLGLARARNALLHTVGTTHAFQLDADNTAVPAGAAAVFDVARRYGSAFTYGTVLKVDQDGRGLARDVERAAVRALAPVQLHRHDGGGRRRRAPPAPAGGPRTRCSSTSTTGRSSTAWRPPAS